jgi:hypothetical protein
MDDSEQNASASHSEGFSQDSLYSKETVRRDKQKHNESQLSSVSNIFSMKNALKAAKLNKSSVLHPEENSKESRLEKEIERLHKQVITLALISIDETSRIRVL